MEVLENRTKATYVNTLDGNARRAFADTFFNLLSEHVTDCKEIVILCIGTDRATGDSLGPLVGYKLSLLKQAERIREFEHVHIYGTLELPIHAKNIAGAVQHIAAAHENSLIIAIDASLGKHEHIGCLTIGKGAIRPGAGLNKKLPGVGDIFITGIVNYTGAMDLVILQNTRLNVVMKMADVVSLGIADVLSRLSADDEAV